MVLLELAYLTKKYGIEIATSKMDAAPFLRDQVTESKIGGYNTINMMMNI